jgi:tetratricopeptide (TPR) repeat protein
MWQPGEERLFNEANDHNSRLEFEQALVKSNELLKHISGDHRKYAYVLACRKAIALRHLGRLDEAEEAFQFASQLAEGTNDRAILAYILTDWSSMRSSDEAVQLVNTAIKLLKQTWHTPDPKRVIEADLAYTEAVLAHHLESTNPSRARALLSNAARVLRIYAHGDYPRYHQAYFIVMMWSVGIGPEQSMLGFLLYAGRLSTAAIEAIRQRKVSVTWERLRQQ